MVRKRHRIEIQQLYAQEKLMLDTFFKVLKEDFF